MSNLESAAASLSAPPASWGKREDRTRLLDLTKGKVHVARPVENLAIIEQFAARLDVLSFGERAATHYGQLRAELERAGHPVGIHDMMIGGHARSEGLTLVSNNLREFQRMEGLRLENWA